jgi:hypothetical protein
MKQNDDQANSKPLLPLPLLLVLDVCLAVKVCLCVCLSSGVSEALLYERWVTSSSMALFVVNRGVNYKEWPPHSFIPYASIPFHTYPQPLLFVCW